MLDFNKKPMRMGFGRDKRDAARDKSDHRNVDLLIAAGYPAVAPVVEDLLAWTIDRNWPIAAKLAKFLFAIGTPIIPFITIILRGSDGTAKWHSINNIINYMPKDLAIHLKPDIKRLALTPTTDDERDEVDEIANEALLWLSV